MQIVVKKTQVFGISGVGGNFEDMFYTGFGPSEDQASLRPIVSLKSNIQITGGNGTLESPYTIQ